MGQKRDVESNFINAKPLKNVPSQWNSESLENSQNYIETDGHTSYRSDMQIYQDVCKSLEADPRVGGSDIEVFVLDAVVTLSGNVDTRSIKKGADDIAESIAGVHDVRNDLTVKKWDDYSSSFDTWSKY